VPVTVLANVSNRGFPAAINQGLQIARGEYLVLLNNDVVVTDAWLDQLVALANAGRTESVIGLVGPMSNYAAPPQLVEAVPYSNLAEMHLFAQRWRDEHRGKWLTVPKLSGFCLLMKRAVYDAVGGLDERFGIGFFDDDDLAERARRAGFALAVAHDLFVHHFGSRTFAGNGVDAERLLEENARRFTDKWGLPQMPGRRVALQPFADRPGVDLENGHADRQRFLPRIAADQRGSEKSYTSPTRQRGTPAEADPQCTAAPLADASGWYGDGHPRGAVPRPSVDATDSPDSALSFDPRSSATIRGEKEPSGRSAATVSLTMIVKTEEMNLRPCLESARGLFDEIVIVDTGSTDRTKEIALDFGAEVFDFVWVDNLAAARNEALAHATGDYVFWLDADDVLDPPQQDKLRALLGGLSREDEAAYVVRCACDPAPDGTGGETVVDHIRLFRRILSLARPDEFCSVDQAIFGHLTRRNLAALAAERGDHARAEQLWAEVLAECPGDREAVAKLERRRLAPAGL
jgi:GT2 family glycosyltransferase